MPRFFSQADNPEDWQELLAKPRLQWKTGYSARSLAYSWTEAQGFPREILDALNSSDSEALHDLEFLLGIPEHEVPLPGGQRPSQNDVFVLAKGSSGLVSIAVEGKVSEPFDLPVDERFTSPTSGQTARLEYLLGLLNLRRIDVGPIGYQLLHRTASALLEAERFGGHDAVMLVHSFSQALEHFDDYSRLARLYGIDATPDSVMVAKNLSGITLHMGWVVGNPVYLTR